MILALEKVHQKAGLISCGTHPHSWPSAPAGRSNQLQPSLQSAFGAAMMQALSFYPPPVLSAVLQHCGVSQDSLGAQGCQGVVLGLPVPHVHTSRMVVDGWPVALPASALAPAAPSSQHGAVLKKGGQSGPAACAVHQPGVVVPKWIPAMLGSSFFGPCDAHKALKKCECTFFCTTCAAKHCQHCTAEHQGKGHQVIQIRRYVYCDVIRALDINQYMDTAGVQSYIINQAKVMFLNPRPQSRLGAPTSPDTCRTCARHLREGAAYCCLSCKVSALISGDAWTPPPESPAASTGHNSAGSSFDSDVEEATPVPQLPNKTPHSKATPMLPASGLEPLPHAPFMMGQPPHQDAMVTQFMAGLLPLLGSPAGASMPVGSWLEAAPFTAKHFLTQLPPPLPLDLTSPFPATGSPRNSSSPEGTPGPTGGSFTGVSSDPHDLFVRSGSVAASMGSIMTAAGINGLFQSNTATMAAGASSPSLATSAAPQQCSTDEESSQGVQGRDGGEGDDERVSEDEMEAGGAPGKRRLPDVACLPSKRSRACSVILAHQLAEPHTSSSSSDTDELAHTPVFLVPGSAGALNPAGAVSPVMGMSRQPSATCNSRRKQNSPKKAAE